MTMTTESGAYQRDDGITVIPRGEFARDRFDYKPGQHLTALGPSGRGKTTLVGQLAGATQRQQRQLRGKWRVEWTALAKAKSTRWLR